MYIYRNKQMHRYDTVYRKLLYSHMQEWCKSSAHISIALKLYPISQKRRYYVRSVCPVSGEVEMFEPGCLVPHTLKLSKEEWMFVASIEFLSIVSTEEYRQQAQVIEQLEQSALTRGGKIEIELN